MSIGFTKKVSLFAFYFHNKYNLSQKKAGSDGARPQKRKKRCFHTSLKPFGSVRSSP